MDVPDKVQCLVGGRGERGRGGEETGEAGRRGARGGGRGRGEGGALPDTEPGIPVQALRWT